VTSPEVLDEGVATDHDACGPVPFETPHRPQPRFQTSMVGLDSIVGELGGVVERGGQEFHDHPDQGLVKGIKTSVGGRVAGGAASGRAGANRAAVMGVP
jgi:hypothetical protein